MQGKQLHSLVFSCTCWDTCARGWAQWLPGNGLGGLCRGQKSW